MNHLILAKCSSAAYIGINAFKKLGFEEVIKFGSGKREAKAYLAISHTSQQAVLAFRGTESWYDIWHDVRFVKRRTVNGRYLHDGFLERWRSIRVNVNIACKSLPESYSLYVTGHSLGGALAAIYCLQGVRKAKEVVSFGAPRVGSHEAARKMDECGLIRYVNTFDIVPKIPRVGYVHGGKEIVLGQSLDGIPFWKRVWGWMRKPKDLVRLHRISSYIRRLRHLK